VECPRCKSPNLRKSKRGNAMLVFPLSWLMTSIRCHNCGKRYLHFGVLPGYGIPDADADSPAKTAR
jgi:hypothetical protein